jgi:uncharacterized damage-inducible protein DinB
MYFEEMIAMSTGLSDFLQYNLWANRRLLDACSHLADEQLDATLTKGTYGSVRKTLTHIFTSEEGYVPRSNLTSAAPTPPLKEFTTFPGFDELRRRAEWSGNELIAVAEHADLDKILHLDGGTYDAPVIILLIQAINHGVDHRSQISTILTQQGVTPPVLDAWAYNDWLRS